MSTPLFVLGNPRSGTSLLRIMLDTHPDICVPPECGFIQWWFKKYSDWGLEDSTSEEKVSEFVSDLATSRKIETWELNFQTLRNQIFISKPQNYSELCLLVIEVYALSRKRKNLTYLGDKNNYYIDHTPLLNTIFPEAVYIVIIRDCRDVACSYIDLSRLKDASPYKPNLPTRVKQIAHEWQENNTKILSFLETIDTQKWTVIRYEDLILDCRNTLSKVCSKLNIPFSQEMLSYYQSSNEPEALLGWKKKTLQQPDPKSVGRFKSLLDADQIETINTDAASLLKAYNYL